MDASLGVDIRCSPRSDRAFEAAVRAALERIGPLDPSDPTSQAVLEREVRLRYPQAVVRSQDPLAGFGIGPVVWYVSRRTEPTFPGAPGDAESVAASNSARLDTAGRSGARAIYSAAGAASLVGLPLSVLLGWEEEGLIVPARTVGGNRIYSRDDVEDLLAMKRGVTAGESTDLIGDRMAMTRAARIGGSSRRTPGGRRVLILLAERDPYAAEIAEYLLRTEGFDVEVAYAAGEAEDKATSLGPDLAVVELLISGGQGAELCARLKAENRTVLAISSLDSEDAALQAGADAFLVKPYDPLEFVSTVKDLLRDSALVRQSTAADNPEPAAETQR